MKMLEKRTKKKWVLSIDTGTLITIQFVLICWFMYCSIV